LLGIQMANNAGTMTLFVERWTNATTFSSTVYSVVLSIAVPVIDGTKGVFFCRWRNNATTLFADISLDGYKWNNVYSEAVAAFLTPTGYGIGMRNGGSSAGPYTTLLGWYPVNNATL